MKDLIKAKEILLSGKYTCVICKGNEIFTSEFRGVKPLVKWYAENTELEGFSAADKVVGKATAYLYALLGVKRVFAKVISLPAKEVLENHQIAVEFETLVPNIINRAGDGICPFELAVQDTDDAEEAYKIISFKMEEMGISI